jgi:choline-sulfatase/glucosamine-6-phosphate deaminase
MGVAGAAGSFSQSPDRRPNILVLLTDQQTQAALSAHGNPYLKTPAMDSLAARGVSFTRSYTPYPLCSPARSSWWTGRMPHETGVRHNGKRIAQGMPMMGDVFRQNGYDTVYGGKWHLGREVNGFRTIAGHTNLGSQMDAPLAEACVQFLEARPKRPFLLAASFLNPHDICQWIRDHAGSHRDEKTPRYPAAPANMAADPDEPEWMHYHRTSGYNSMSEGVIIASKWQRDDFRRYLDGYYRLVENVDRQIGRVLDALKRSGLEENTVVAFTSDHGEGLGAHRWVQKVAFYEESATVPLIFAGPGVSRRAIDQTTFASGIDLMPTLCGFAGIRGPKMTGIDLRPALSNGTVDRRFVVSELSEYGKPDRQGRMLRTDRYKYVAFNGGANREQLFDLELDPGEMQNLARQPDAAAVLREHRDLLRQWGKDTADDFAA